MSSLGFSGQFRILSSVYSARGNHEKGVQDYKKVKAALTELMPRIKALPDSVVINYGAEFRSEHYTQHRLKDVVTLEMMTEYDEKFSHQISLPVTENVKKRGEIYYDLSVPPTVLDTSPDYYQKFIGNVVGLAEVLADLFKAKSDDPYKLP